MALKSADEVAPQTRDALALAMQLLDPEHPQSISGWRDELNEESLAHLLDISSQDAAKRLGGRATWTEAERAKLVWYLSARRVEATGEGEARDDAELNDLLAISSTPGVPEGTQRLPTEALIVGQPFRLHTVEWRPTDLSRVVTVILTITVQGAVRQARVRVTNSRLLRDLYELDEGRRATAMYVITRKRPGLYRLQEVS